MNPDSLSTSTSFALQRVREELNRDTPDIDTFQWQCQLAIRAEKKRPADTSIDSVLEEITVEVLSRVERELKVRSSPNLRLVGDLTRHTADIAKDTNLRKEIGHSVSTWLVDYSERILRREDMPCELASECWEDAIQTAYGSPQKSQISKRIHILARRQGRIWLQQVDVEVVAKATRLLNSAVLLAKRSKAKLDTYFTYLDSIALETAVRAQKDETVEVAREIVVGAIDNWQTSKKSRMAKAYWRGLRLVKWIVTGVVVVHHISDDYQRAEQADQILSKAEQRIETLRRVERFGAANRVADILELCVSALRALIRRKHVSLLADLSGENFSSIEIPLVKLVSNFNLFLASEIGDSRAGYLPDPIVSESKTIPAKEVLLLSLFEPLVLKNRYKFIEILSTAEPWPSFFASFAGKYLKQKRSRHYSTKPHASNEARHSDSKSITEVADAEPYRHKAAPRGHEPRGDEAFSRGRVVETYPAPIALAYGRFLSLEERDYCERLDCLFNCVEAIMRYLVTLGLGDLIHCLATTHKTIEPAEYVPETLRFFDGQKNMTMGLWRDLLGLVAKSLKSYENCMIKELPDQCDPRSSPGKWFHEHLLGPFITLRNDKSHPPAMIFFNKEMAKDALPQYITKLESILVNISFVCNYPLGFILKKAASADCSLHSAMGRKVDDVPEGHEFSIDHKCLIDCVFILGKNKTQLCSLWPLLHQGLSSISLRQTLYVLEGIEKHRYEKYIDLKYHAVDGKMDKMSEKVGSDDMDVHSWLVDRVRDNLPAMRLPLSRELAPKLARRPKTIEGKRLGRYQLHKAVDWGGVAVVYLASDTTFEGSKDVAVKVLATHYNRSQRDHRIDCDRFEQEKDILWSVDHQHIVSCDPLEHEYFNGVVDGTRYLAYAMEYAVGSDLSLKIEERGQNAWHSQNEQRSQIIEEFRAVLSAAAYLHRENIVHCDIKPRNILVVRGGVLKLADFGTAKVTTPRAMSIDVTGFLGTPIYSAPELETCDDYDQILPTADIYSLGILLAELLTGKKPDVSPTVGTGTRLAAWLRDQDIPEEFKRLIRKCTNLDPKHRPSNASVLLSRFEKISDVVSLSDF